MITRTVAIDLSCADEGCGQTAFFGGARNRDVLKAARAAGWWVHGEKALCPKHKQIQSAWRQERALREVRT